METKLPDHETLHLYQEAATALLLWQFRLRPRALATREERLPGGARGQLPFEALVSHGPVSLPAGMSLEMADRFWSAILYKAEVAALLCLAPQAVERHWAPRTPLAALLGSSTELDTVRRAALVQAAETLGVPDRKAWTRELETSLDRRFADPLAWNGIEVLITAVRELGVLPAQEVERLLERAGALREPWPDWMPGEAPAKGFYFD